MKLHPESRNRTFNIVTRLHPEIIRRSALVGVGTLLLGALLAFSSPSGAAQEWNQWRGYHRNGQAATNAPWPTSISASNLVQQWTVQVGPSYSGPVVQADRVVTTATIDKKYEIVVALSRKDGRQLWKQQWEGAMKVPFFARSNGDWIRSTPAIADDSVFVAGMKDLLVCLDVSTGAVRWRLDFVKELGTPTPDFGFVCSPLVDESGVYVQAGAGLAKVDKVTGKILWHALKDQGGMWGSAFSSPLLAELGGSRQLIVQTRTKLAGVDPASGNELWSQPVEAFRGMNILTPLLFDNGLFTSTYGGKTTFYSFQKKDGKSELTESWTHKAQGYMSTPVVIGGIAYCHLKSQRLMAIDLKTGTERWTTGESFGKYMSLVTDGQNVLGLDERGSLVLFRGSPDRFESLGTRKVSEEEAWGHVAVDHGQVFIRSLNSLTAWRWQ